MAGAFPQLSDTLSYHGT